MIHVNYSCRKAACGSTVAARRAGSQLASKVTAARNAGTLVKVIQSCGATPHNTPAATFGAAHASGSPMPIAMHESTTPCRTFCCLTAVPLPYDSDF
jgi:hypothetical protein